MGVLSKHAPMKEKRVRKRFQPDWFNSEITEAIRQRNKAKFSEPSMYRQARNNVTRLLRNAKRNYFHNAITKNRGNSKAIWHILRNVQSNNTNTKNQQSPNLVIVQGKETESPEEVANALTSLHRFISVRNT